MRLLFDCETDGFLDVMTCIHCLTIKDADTGARKRYVGHTEIERGIDRLRIAEEIIGQNIIKFDIPAIQKIFPGFEPRGKVRDTMVMARLLWPEIKKFDLPRVAKGFPGKLVGKHSLEAWGRRLGNYKGDYKGPWDTYTDVMGDYCDQDVEVTHALLLRCEKENPTEASLELEHEVQRIIATQEKHGFMFDTVAAASLWGSLSEKREQLEGRLKDTFASWYSSDGEFTPKKDLKSRGYIGGATFTRVKMTAFNPGSRDHIADRLITLYGWEPTEFTDGGKPKVDETTMAALDLPVTPLIMEYLLVEKRIGQIAEGKEAWLKAERGGRIYGAVNTCGAVTYRMTHFKPNMAQVPKVGSAYGAECRALFIVPRGKKLVGADASGLELRCLGHFLAPYDNGAYAHAVIEGKSSDGTDVHSLTCVALGLDPKHLYTVRGKQMSGRDIAKRFIYAFLYGAGDEKLGSIVGKGAGAGRKLKTSFLEKMPAIGKLIKAVKIAAKRGYLIGLDGRKLRVRSEHAALNVLLQSAGALVMKRALVILDASITATGLIRYQNYSFVANIHDEFQIEVDEQHAEEIGKLAVEAIRQAGEAYKFRCALDGEFKVGNNWCETH